VNGSGRPEQASLLDAQRAESYLRQRVGQELAAASSLAQVQATADDRATTAKARIARTAALAGALAAVGAIPDTAAVSALDGLRAALVQQGCSQPASWRTGRSRPARRASRTRSGRSRLGWPSSARSTGSASRFASASARW
jgi:hypothetical protein